MITIAPSRSHALDTLRAIAILLVMLFHIGNNLPTFLQPLARIGWMGVDLFFVLSGYLIGGQLLRPVVSGGTISLRNFYIRRAWRILPAYLAVLALYLFVPAWRESSGLAHAWQFLTFTLNLNIDYIHANAFSHAWSLCVEEHFYLCLPLLVIVLLRYLPSIRHTAVLVATVLLTGLIFRTVALHHLRTLLPGSNDFEFYYLEHIYYPTWTRLDGLLAGVLLAAIQLFRPLWWQALLRQSRTLLTVAVWLVATSALFFANRFDSAKGFAAAGTIIGFPLLAAGFACLIVSVSSPDSALARRIPGGRAIATLAFSLYLVHPGVFHLVQVAFPVLCQRHHVLALPVYAIAALTAASALYFTIERPGLQLRDHRRNITTAALADPAI